MDGKRTALYAGTGNVSIYRVSEETRRKVQRQTRAIAENIQEQNERSKQRSRQEEHERALLHERERLRMVDRWKTRYKDSPYKVLNFKQELERIHTEETLEARRLDDLRKRKMVESMTGRYNDIYVDKDTVRPLSTKHQLALQYRRHLMDESKVQSEWDDLERLADEENRVMERKFPHIRSVLSDSVSLSSSAQASSEGLSSISEQPLSHQRRPPRPTVQATAAAVLSSSRPGTGGGNGPDSALPSVRKMLSRKGPRLGANYEIPALEGSTVSSDNRPLVSPATGMQQLADDLSMEFAALAQSPVTRPPSAAHK